MLARVEVEELWAAYERVLGGLGAVIGTNATSFL